MGLHIASQPALPKMKCLSLDRASCSLDAGQSCFLLCRFLLYCICRCLIFSHRLQIIRTYLNKIFLTLLPECSHCLLPAKLPFQFFPRRLCRVHCSDSTSGAWQCWSVPFPWLCASVQAGGTQVVTQGVLMHGEGSSPCFPSWVSRCPYEKHSYLVWIWQHVAMEILFPIHLEGGFADVL